MTPGSRERDPENRLLGRGPRVRLPVEMIRDQALAVSGLMAEVFGGPPVKPYHPGGLYEQIVYQGGKPYQQGSGADLYRRSLYTYRKRSVPHPAMLTFDAPFRETCIVRRARTSTPLQALNLMNDPTYVEAARFLAQRMMLEGGTSPEARIAYGFRDGGPSAAAQRARGSYCRLSPHVGRLSSRAIRSRRVSANRRIPLGPQPRPCGIGGLRHGREHTVEPRRDDHQGLNFMDPIQDYGLSLTRRHFFGRSAVGIGAAAPTSLLGRDAFSGTEETRNAVGGLSVLPHLPPKAKRVIYLFQAGAPSQADLFDHKPGLEKERGRGLPDSVRQGQRLTGMTSGKKPCPSHPRSSSSLRGVRAASG